MRGRGACREAGVREPAAAQAACTGKARLLKTVGSMGTRSAHREHAFHDCDLGRVEAHRLVERRRDLPSQTEGIRCGAMCRSGRWEGAWGGCGTRGMHGGGPDCDGWPQGRGGAHVEHVVHVRDAGRIEVHRLVERRRHLSSRKEGVRCGGGCGPAGGGDGVQRAVEGSTADRRKGKGHGEERT